jgi:hypothetical protein
MLTRAVVALSLAGAVASVLVACGGGGQPSTSELIQTLLQDPSRPSQIEAARLLAVQLDPALTRRIVRTADRGKRAQLGVSLLRNRYIAIYRKPTTPYRRRVAAIRSLAEIDDATSAGAVAGALLGDKVAAVRATAIAALATMKGSASLVADRLVRERSVSAATLPEITRALVLIGRPAVKSLMPLMPDNRWAVNVARQIDPSAVKRAERLARARVAEEIVSQLCTGSPVPLYRAPSLFPGGKQEDPLANTYIRVLSPGYAQGTQTGFQLVRRVACKKLVVLGAAAYFSLDDFLERAAKWVYVALKGKPAVRGWAYLESGGEIDWSKLPTVRPSVLFAAFGAQAPDLAFGTYEPRFQVGDRCDSPLTVNDYVVDVRNNGPGVGADKLAIGAEGYEHHETKSLSFARPLLPGESITLSIFNGARLKLDPQGELDEASEGNNALTLPYRQPPLRCG